jgi:hypothetical protein
VETRYEFATPEPPRLRVGLGAGRVEIEEAAETDRTAVEVEALRGDVEGLRVEQHGRGILVEQRKRLRLGRDDEFAVRVRMPTGSHADVEHRLGRRDRGRPSRQGRGQHPLRRRPPRRDGP